MGARTLRQRLGMVHARSAADVDLTVVNAALAEPRQATLEGGDAAQAVDDEAAGVTA